MLTPPPFPPKMLFVFLKAFQDLLDFFAYLFCLFMNLHSILHVSVCVCVWGGVSMMAPCPSSMLTFYMQGQCKIFLGPLLYTSVLEDAYS